MSYPARSLLVCFLSVVLCGVRSAQEDYVDFEFQDLTDLSLEALLDMEVTVVSRSEQKLSDVPGAVYVITGDEIRRAGHRSIQEALRMVPGFYVSNWTTSQWDVTSRGFGTGLSLTSLAYLNQLLVLIDGVVVYTPLFAGTWWAPLRVDARMPCFPGRCYCDNRIIVQSLDMVLDRYRPCRVARWQAVLVSQI